MNVIVIVIDTLRKDHIGAYGNKWIKTPNLDRLATESAVFTRAASESLPTLPHRRSVHTGMRTFPYRKSFYADGRGLDLSKLTLGKGAQVPASGERRGGNFMGMPGIVLPGWEPIPSDQVTLGELLHLYGFDTALVTDTSPYWSRPHSLVDMNYQRGYRYWEYIHGHEYEGGFPFRQGLDVDLNRFIPVKMRGNWEQGMLERDLTQASHWKTEEDYLAAQVWRRAAIWLEDNYRPNRPFLLWVDSLEPHEPFIIPPEYFGMYDIPGYKGVEPIMPKYGPIDYLSETELRRMRALYAANVTFVDKWLGVFLDKAKATGALTDTVLCLTSDHGFQLGEHGVTGKVDSHMWKDLHEVPYIIRHPHGLGAGKRFDAFTQGQDLYASILSFLGIPFPYELDGKDLWPVIRGEKHKVRDYITCGMGRNVRAVDDENSFISLASGEEPQLRDLRSDPLERDDIAKDNNRIVKRMFDYVMEDAGHQPVLGTWERQVSYRFSVTQVTPTKAPPINMDKPGF